MASTILVTGGTGTLGRQVVPLLRDAGRDVRVLTRRARESADGVDYVTGDLAEDVGVRAAVEGASVVLHLAGGAKGDDVVARNLVRAAKAAGVEHLVLISVTGADRLPLKWVRTQHEVEKTVMESGIPWTILRAAQFHDLVLKMVRTMAKSPVVPVPRGLRMQPVDARDVAERLAELTLGAPSGRVPDLVGPKVYGMGELIRSYLRASGKRRALPAVPIPGKVGRVYRAGENIVLEGAVHGTCTWEEFLADHVTRAAKAPAASR
ncbi:SDR family oxidoreductase [Actinomadura chibensis]|uniref:NAD(P)H-binding protein n=1 Tax=Actinomadura chibensis TaxID=392828 RepID=A0A5D0NLE8_9ACTN|nr:NAD(P)H-binding protein [Actinomadura chibensis]TYB45320.1 NAD(P)H-binding protein [Actinomadura chibensis]